MWEKSLRQVPCASWLLAVVHRLQCQAPASLLGQYGEEVSLVFLWAAAKLAMLCRLHSRNISPKAPCCCAVHALTFCDRLQVMGKNKVLCKVHPEGK